MDVIFLPLLSPDATLNDALFAMDKHLRAAVVKEARPGYYLARAVDIYAGTARQLVTLADLPDRFPMHEVSNFDILTRNLDMGDPHNSSQAFEQLLDAVNRKYAVLDFLPGVARVVTRNEQRATQFLSTPAACYCDNEEYMHPYPPPNVSSGQTCHYCPHKITCR